MNGVSDSESNDTANVAVLVPSTECETLPPYVTELKPTDLAPIAGASAGLADQLVTRTFSVVAEERLLAMAHDVESLARMGRAAALLSYIIVKCGNADGSVINLHQAAQNIGQPYSTVKTWLTVLEDAALISKSSLGRDGVRVDLLTDHVRRLPVFEEMGKCLGNAATMLRAVQTTTVGALEHAAAPMRKWMEVLSC